MCADILTSILTELNGDSSDIEASAIISTTGLTMASALSAGLDEDRVGAMSSAVLSFGARTAEALARGEFEQVVVKGAEGYVLMIYAGKGAVLTALARSGAELESVFLDLKRTVESLKQLI